MKLVIDYTPARSPVRRYRSHHTRADRSAVRAQPRLRSLPLRCRHGRQRPEGPRPVASAHLSGHLRAKPHPHLAPAQHPLSTRRVAGRPRHRPIPRHRFRSRAGHGTPKTADRPRPRIRALSRSRHANATALPKCGRAPQHSQGRSSDRRQPQHGARSPVALACPGRENQRRPGRGRPPILPPGIGPARAAQGEAKVRARPKGLSCSVSARYSPERTIPA